jgi:diguanylate cyclase (GGDEF)-like protein/PAS domain S-box-containing protein
MLTPAQTSARDVRPATRPARAPRILIVDDQPTIRMVVSAVLESARYDVAIARGGRETLEFIENEHCDLVLLDILMPDLGGLEVLDRIRKRRNDVELPVIIVTVKTDTEGMVNAFGLGANDYLVKPIDANVLLARVRSQLARKQHYEAHTGALAREAEERADAARRAQDELRVSEDRFRKAFHASPDAIVLSALADGRVLEVNDAFEQITGYRREEVLGKTTEQLKYWRHPHERADFIAALKERGSIRNWRAALRTRAGEFRVCEVAAEFIDLHGTPAMLSIARDVTDRELAEQALIESERNYRDLYENTPAIYLTIGPARDIRSVNRFCAAALGYQSAAELAGKPLLDLVFQDDRAATATFVERSFGAPDSAETCEQRLVRRDGSIMWVKLTVRCVEAPDGERQVVAVCDDVTNTRRLYEQLSFQASHDMLTGLVNRRGFEQRLQWLLSAPQIEEVEHILFYLNFDNFKVINDTCGHLAGDVLLRKLGNLLRQHVRRHDTLARFGGDEFAVLMEYSGMEAALNTAADLLKKIAQFRFAWSDQTLAVGLSIGLASTSGTTNMVELLERADSACRTAKDKGGNRVHVYRDDDLAISSRTQDLKWVARINRALDNNQFMLYCQQIAPAGGIGAIHGNHYEILVRMRDADGGTIAPGAFLPAAERYRLAPRLDRWVIEAALQWLAQSATRVDELELCAINLSGLSLGIDEFVQFVVSKLAESSIPPEKICFEITETAAIADISSAQQFIRVLKEQGCKFALDDFGSGLSSFAYLKNLPIDFLKIDGMFVRNIVEDAADFAMVKSINDIGRVLNIRTIAEFVENDGILQKLREIGVDYVQGYGIGRPRPLGE